MDGFRDLVRAHVQRFNHAVRCGDWQNYAEGFTHDAVVTFEGLPAPTLVGRDAIAAGYAASPPDDTITVRSTSIDGETINVDYAWDERPTVSGGSMTLTVINGQINNLQVKVC